MNNKIKISIVFLNYNRLSETRRTVSHLENILYYRDDIEVIAVDNGSIDGTREYLYKQRDFINVLYMDKNIGIEALNYGFKKACGEYILVLDDDSHPYDEECLDLIVQHLDNNQNIGIVACQIESDDNQPVLTWHLPKNGKPGYSMAFIGCGFAIRRNLFENIGWFPGHFFLYQNELAVAIKIMSQGYMIYYEPRCRVVHRQTSGIGRVSNRQVYFATRNTIWLIRQYYPLPISLYMILSRLCMGFIRGFQARDLKTYLNAVYDGINRPIQKEVLEKELFDILTPFFCQNSLFHRVITVFN